MSERFALFDCGARVDGLTFYTRKQCRKHYNIAKGALATNSFLSIRKVTND